MSMFGNLTPMNFDEFDEFLGGIEDEEALGLNREEEELPYPIDYESAVKEAKFLLGDYSPDQVVTMVIFEFENGYQVDVLSEDNPEFEIYDNLYESDQVKAIVKWDGKDKAVREIN